MRKSFGNPSINPTPLNDAYAEGVEACHSGKIAADCPYKMGDQRWGQWMDGYNDSGCTD